MPVSPDGSNRFGENYPKPPPPTTYFMLGNTTIIIDGLFANPPWLTAPTAQPLG